MKLNQTKSNIHQFSIIMLGNSFVVFTKVLDYGLEVSEFELKPRYYVLFRTDMLIHLTKGIWNHCCPTRMALALNNQ